jgi:hypothetical protein
LTLTVGISVRL